MKKFYVLMNQAGDEGGAGGGATTTTEDKPNYEEVIKQLQTQLSEKEQALRAKEDAELNAQKQKATEANDLASLLEIERAERSREAKEKQEALERLQKIQDEADRKEQELFERSFEETIMQQLGDVTDPEMLMLAIKKHKASLILPDRKNKNINGFNADGIRQIVDWVRTEKPHFVKSGSSFQTQAPTDTDKRTDEENKKIADLKQKSPRLASLLEQAQEKKKATKHATTEWKGLDAFLQNRKK
jgi:hypothetical protein